MLNKGSAIIFGITGQDGYHLTHLLLEKNYTVVGVSRRSSGNNLQRLEGLVGDPCLTIVQGDITDYHSILGILNEYATDGTEIYNLAAQSHIGTSFKQPILTWEVNGTGCLNLLQAIVDSGLKNKVRYYQASSSEMFGKNYDRDTNTFVKYQDEDTKFLPQNPYAVAKCAAHQSVRLFREVYGLHASSGILFNHEGPLRGEEFVTRKITKWIGNFLRWLKKVNIKHTDLSSFCRDGDSLYASGVQYSFPKLRLGNLEASRDWGYAGDYVEAMWMMLQQPKADDYVICTGETHTIREFLDAAFKLVGINDWSMYVVKDPDLYRPSEIDYVRGDYSKAKQILKWEPKYKFHDLVKLMVEHDAKGISNEKKL